LLSVTASLAAACALARSAFLEAGGAPALGAPYADESFAFDASSSSAASTSSSWVASRNLPGAPARRVVDVVFSVRAVNAADRFGDIIYYWL
jgi:hypothetical protein